MNVNGSLEQRVGLVGEHEHTERLHQLASFESQDGRAQNFVRGGVHHEREGVAFYTRQKVVTARWHRAGEGDIWHQD